MPETPKTALMFGVAKLKPKFTSKGRIKKTQNSAPKMNNMQEDKTMDLMKRRSLS